MEDRPELVTAVAARLGPPGDGLVVAVSGGPDSVALARAAHQAHPPGAGTLVLAHLNHQLRGAESDADEAFVVALAGQLPGVTLCHGRRDVAAEAAHRNANLEATARSVRYEWLVEVARQHGVGRVATGHTADDQAETVLHRLLRGTGLQGLRGIAASRPLAADVELVRPLLGVTRAEVIQFLQSLGQTYREDSSNRDPRHTRNRIRHELLPLLAARFNPAVVTVLNRLAEQADAAFREQEAAAAARLAAAELPRAGSQLVFDAARLAALSDAELRAVLRLAWVREGWPLDAMGFDAWQRLADQARGRGTTTDFPGGVRAAHRGRAFLLGRPA